MPAGAPLGNQNAAKAKRWEAALERATSRLATGEKADPNDDRSDFMKGIDQLADNFVARMRGANDKSAAGYYAQFGDRLDGKPAQAITGSGGGDLVLQIVTKDASVL